jgi:hypothetical protein
MKTDTETDQRAVDLFWRTQSNEPMRVHSLTRGQVQLWRQHCRLSDGIVVEKSQSCTDAEYAV